MIQKNVFILSLIVLMTLNPSGELNARKKTETGFPVFSSYVYQGEDQVYTDSPLKSDEFYNPLLQGCYPDPSIVRKGDDYFLVTSTFAMFPGVPIFSFQRFGQLETNRSCARPKVTIESAGCRH